MDIKKVLLNNKNLIYEFSLSNYSDKSVFIDKCAKYVSKNNCIFLYNTTNCSDNCALEAGFKLRQLCAFYDSLFIVNSRADLAKILNADGLCLNYNDISLKQSKLILSDDKLFCYRIQKDCAASFDKDFDFLISESAINNLDFNITVYLKYNKTSFTEYKRINYEHNSKN